MRGRRFDVRASLRACGLVQPYGGKVSTAAGLYLNPDATKRHGPICKMQTDTHDPSSLRAGAHARERAFSLRARSTSAEGGIDDHRSPIRCCALRTASNRLGQLDLDRRLTGLTHIRTTRRFGSTGAFHGFLRRSGLGNIVPYRGGVGNICRIANAKN